MTVFRETQRCSPQVQVITPCVIVIFAEPLVQVVGDSTCHCHFGGPLVKVVTLCPRLHAKPRNRNLMWTKEASLVRVEHLWWRYGPSILQVFGGSSQRYPNSQRRNVWLVGPKCSERPCSLTVRCRLFLSLRRQSPIASTCSSVRKKSDLGSDRRETRLALLMNSDL